MLLFRPPVLRFGRPGVKPADFAALGTAASPLANDADLPADASSEWLWALLTPLPGSGTTQVNDQGGYALTGAADGTYTQTYRGLVMPPTGAVTVYESSITVTVGSAGVGLASEADTAFALTGHQLVPAGLAAQTDTALALTGRQIVALGLAAETDTALALTPRAGNAPGIAAETDTALALLGLQATPVGLAVEVEVAYALPVGGGAGGGTINPAAFWGYVLSNGQSVGDNIVAVRALLTAIAAGINIDKVAGVPVQGRGIPGTDPWRGS